MVMLYLYVTGPVDFGWEAWPTIYRALQTIGCEEEHLAAEIDARFLEAKAFALRCGWEGDFRRGSEPRVFVLPGEAGTLLYGIIWKQDNNGTTFIATPERLPWLEDDWCRIYVFPTESAAPAKSDGPLIDEGDQNDPLLDAASYLLRDGTVSIVMGPEGSRVVPLEEMLATRDQREERMSTDIVQSLTASMRDLLERENAVLRSLEQIDTRRERERAEQSGEHIERRLRQITLSAELEAIRADGARLRELLVRAYRRTEDGE